MSELYPIEEILVKSEKTFEKCCEVLDTMRMEIMSINGCKNTKCQNPFVDKETEIKLSEENPEYKALKKSFNLQYDIVNILANLIYIAKQSGTKSV